MLTPSLALLRTAVILVAFLAASCTAKVEPPEKTSYGRDPSFERLAPNERESIREARVDEPVLILGDSLVMGARDAGQLQRKLEEVGWVPEFTAEIGRGIPWAMDRLAYRDSVPPTMVIVLGTNPSATVGEFSQEVEKLLARLTELGAKRFLWVPPVHLDPERYRERQVVLEQTASDERILLTDWPGITVDHPEWFSGDGIHLSVAGYDALADSIADWLDVLSR